MNTTPIPTFADRTMLRLNNRIRDLLLIVAGSLFVTVFAWLRIPLPFTPVPLTGQTFAVLLVGAALGSRRGAASLLLYLIQGMIGMPVFAGGASGLAYLIGPTGGYLLGFVCAAYTVGWLAEKGLERHFYSAWAVFLAGELVIYLFGVPWLGVHIGMHKALTAGLLPFLTGDLIKLVAAALVLPTAWRLVK